MAILPQLKRFVKNFGQNVMIAYRPRIILPKVEVYFSLPLDGGGLGWG
jgi:hypothetical protein